MVEKKNQKKKILMVVLVLGLVLLTVGTTYALFTYTRQGEKTNTLKTGTMYFVYDEDSTNPSNVVNIQNAFPVSDETGKVQEGEGQFEFTVRATTQGADINYEIYLTKEATSTLPENVVRTYLTKDGTDVTPTLKEETINSYSELSFSQLPILEGKDGKTLHQETISNGISSYEKTFVYRMWLDENANSTRNGEWLYGGMNFSVKVNVYASNDTLPEPKALYKDNTGANIPTLVEGMIPVTFNEDTKNWEKADVTQEWYDYAKWNWANAVTLEESARTDLMKDPVGTIIDMKDINTMWVWIPRYEYDYTNIATVGADKANPGAIGVKFLSGTSESSTDGYMLHPAFTFGTQNLEGFWYGKFETSSKEECTAIANAVNGNCDVTTLTPQIKPGVASWRGIRNSTAFLVSQSMNDNSTYGFNKTSDIHMSKNNEWGAVAYLSQSTYGKQGNINYIGANKEVYQNKSEEYITGSSNGTPSTNMARTEGQYAYDNLTQLEGEGQGLAGPGASTTGTIYGVYDMSGGAWERVMGVIEDEEGKPRSGNNEDQNSGYSGKLENGTYFEGRELPELKYYGIYGGSMSATGCNGGLCYGESLSETIAWYGDQTTWLTNMFPWLARGGRSDGNFGVGIFSFANAGGNALDSGSFRLVLTP